MGTPEFAVPSLEYLINAGHEICGVFTKPDKPQGRKMVLTPPAVKLCAQNHKIKVFQPEKLKNSQTFDLIKELSPELIVVVAYGKILPKNIIDFPKYGCINVHGSLLPKYRGAAPIQWSIINGEKVTGITTMFMDEGLDTGDILLQSKVFINDDDTSENLYTKLSTVGAELIVKTVNELESGNLTRIKQKDSDATFAPPLEKTNSIIDWSKPAQEIHNLIRGLNPWPIANTTLKNQLFKIYKSKISSKRSEKPGQVISDNPLIIACGENTSLELLEVQIAGKKRMTAGDFSRGYRLSNTITLGKVKK